MIYSTRWLLLTTILVSASCGASQGTHPDDMSADEHRRAAAAEDDEAAGHAEEYAPEAQTTVPASPTSSEVFYGPEVYNPTAGHDSRAAGHRRHAEAHRAAAAALEQYEDAQCGHFPPATRAVCPLSGQVAEVTDLPNGVSIRFADGVSREATTDHVLCHAAFARTRAHEGMPHCPLYLDGVTVDSTDGELVLTVPDEAMVEELRRRARAHVAN